MKDALKEYRAKRDFSKTAEPSGDEKSRKGSGLRFLVQKHAATRLHYDFRLEHDGVLKSWAVTRGPSYDPADKRLAVHTEDHPLAYGDFEGTIPKGEYGGGTVMLWDEGSWEPLEESQDVDKSLREGKLKFVLHGERLRGAWMLVKIKNNRDKRSKAENWLLFKERDDYAQVEATPIIERATTSVRSGRTMDEIAAGNMEWTRAGARVKPGDDPPDDPRPAKPASNRLPAPKFVTPQLATLVEAAPPGNDWLHEIKYDGYRSLAAVGAPKPVIYTRKGLDWSARYRPLLQPLADLPCRSALLDGEICVLGEDGLPDFSALQDALGPGAAAGKVVAFVYYLFDLLFLDGEDLRKRPLIERKELLRKLLADSPPAGPLLFSDHVVGNGPAVFDHARDLNAEGIVSKRADAPYRPDRGKLWLKVKAKHEQEFIIIGWEPSTVKTKPFGALLTAVKDGRKLSYRGKVGTGYSAATLDRVWAKLEPLQRKTAPADDVPNDVARKSHFVEPKLVAQIEHAGMTSEGYIRHGSFKGLRDDKPAGEVTDEIAEDMEEAVAAAEDEAAPAGRRRKPAAKADAKPDAKPEADPPPRLDPQSKSGPRAKAAAKPAPGKGKAKADDPPVPAAGRPVTRTHNILTIEDDKDGNAIEIAGVRVTNPDRVMFPENGVTKRMIIDYYLANAERVLAHVADRPLSIVRCPRGHVGDCFFQKHAAKGFPEEFKPIRIQEKSGSDIYLYIEDERGLVAGVQMGALELHVWGSHVKTLEQPDRLVFDFDPDEEVGFDMVKQAAVEMRERLASIDITSFCMTTGGKGLHVVVPLTPKHDWEGIRLFAEAMARTMADENPARYLAVMSKAKRKGRIFIDYLRNGRGATAIAPFSTRARAGAPVSWPVAWSALGKLENAHPVSVLTAVETMRKQRADPWKGYFDVDQVLPLEALRG